MIPLSDAPIWELILRNNIFLRLFVLGIFLVLTAFILSKSLFFILFPILIWASVGKNLSSFEHYLTSKQDFVLFMLASFFSVGISLLEDPGSLFTVSILCTLGLWTMFFVLTGET